MNDKPPGFFDSPALNDILKSSPPEEVLGMFDTELKHYLNSSRGCIEILSMNPSEETRQRMLKIISRNLDRLEDLRNAVRTYLDQRTK